MYCEPLLAALKECLLQSDCVVKQGHLPSECLKDHTKELPEQCQSLRQATFECKRGMVRGISRLHLGIIAEHGFASSWTCVNDSEATTPVRSPNESRKGLQSQTLQLSRRRRAKTDRTL